MQEVNVTGYIFLLIMLIDFTFRYKTDFILKIHISFGIFTNANEFDY